LFVGIILIQLIYKIMAVLRCLLQNHYFHILVSQHIHMARKLSFAFFFSLIANLTHDESARILRYAVSLFSLFLISDILLRKQVLLTYLEQQLANSSITISINIINIDMISFSVDINLFFYQKKTYHSLL